MASSPAGTSVTNAARWKKVWPTPLNGAHMESVFHFNPTKWSVPGPVPQLTAGAIYIRLSWAIEQLEKWGVRVPAGCRARSALSLVKQLHEANIRGERARLRVDAETREAQLAFATELFLIVYSAARSRYDGHPFTREKLATIVRGSERVEGRDTEPRDKQFELYMASRFRLGGLNVYDGEPDLILRIGDHLRGVAVKRVSSDHATQIRERIKKAVEQINDTQLPGIIAIRLEGRLKNLSAGASEAQLAAEVDPIMNVIFQYSKYFVNNHEVRGVYVVSSLNRPIGAPTRNGYPAGETYQPSRFHRFYAPWDNEQALEAAWDRWQGRMNAHFVYCLSKWMPPPAS